MRVFILPTNNQRSIFEEHAPKEELLLPQLCIFGLGALTQKHKNNYSLTAKASPCERLQRRFQLP
jgi:hypothetical protein